MLQPDAMQDFEGIQLENPNCVVVGLAPDCFNYEQMNKAFRYAICIVYKTQEILKQYLHVESTASPSHPNKMYIFICRLVLDGHSLIAIHKGRYYKRVDGLALGPGPFVTALEYSCDSKSEVVGKPEPGFFQQVLDNMNADAESTVMIGDVSIYIANNKAGIHAFLNSFLEVKWNPMIFKCTFKERVVMPSCSLYLFYSKQTSSNFVFYFYLIFIRMQEMMLVVHKALASKEFL